MGLRFEDVKALKIGDVVYECEGGNNLRARVETEVVEGKGYEDRRTLSFKAVNTENNASIDYLLTEGLTHYGPRLYDQPQYGYFKDGEFVMPLVGA